MCIYFNWLSSFPDSPHPMSTGAVKAAGTAGRGPLSLSETDGRCRQKCRSPSPRETPRGRGSGWALGWKFGATTVVTPAVPTDLFPNAHAGTPQSCTLKHFHRGLPSITSILHTSALAHRHPREHHFCGRKGPGGSHTSPAPPPGTPGPCLACKGGG